MGLLAVVCSFAAAKCLGDSLLNLVTRGSTSALIRRLKLNSRYLKLLQACEFVYVPRYLTT